MSETPPNNSNVKKIIIWLLVAVAFAYLIYVLGNSSEGITIEGGH